MLISQPQSLGKILSRVDRMGGVPVLDRCRETSAVLVHVVPAPAAADVIGHALILALAPRAGKMSIGCRP